VNPSTTPRFDERAAVRIALETYGLNAKSAPLPSERDQNFLLETPAKERFVLKIAKSDEDLAVLDLQNAALRQVATRAPALAVPRVRPSVRGEDIVQLQSETGQAHYVRLIGWLEGQMLADALPHDMTLLSSLGSTMAELDEAISGLTHPAMHRTLHWDLKHADLALEHLSLLSPQQQHLVHGMMQRWSGIDWRRLRFGVIHGDANDHNVLVRDRRVVGLIDFGDLVHSAVVCDLAIAMAYAMLDKPEPVAVGGAIARSYHARLPLQEAEIDVLYALVGARMSMSMCYAAYNARAKSGDAYQQVTAAPAWQLLQKLAELPPERVCAAWRQACTSG
jgi:Ser/Thr protein kinase RdoA (MazF antagonist)